MISRRAMIRGALGAVALGAGGAGWQWGVAAPPSSRDGADARTLLRRVFEALPETERAAALVPFDHPLRHYFNRGLNLGGVRVGATTLGWDARRDLAALAQASLSETGRERIFGQGLLTVSGVNFTQLLFCGDPRGNGPCQAILSAVHLNLRLGGQTPEGAAFGGPQVYGDQRGDHRDGLPGNVFRHQMEQAHRLLASLSRAERAAVRVARAPPQVNVGLQGLDGHFEGVAVGHLSSTQRALARAAVDSIFATYSAADAAAAWRCLDRNGGIDALRFADYDVDYDETDRHFGDAPSQIFRFEGPAAVLHFRGHPHVHAFVNVASDADAPRGGEPLAVNPRRLEGDDLGAWFESAMRARAEADVAIYPSHSVVGRLREGPVYASDVWVAESWANDLHVVEVRGADLSSALSDAIRRRGTPAPSGAMLRIAMPDFLVNAETSHGLRVSSRRSLGSLREALVQQALRHGFGATA